MWTFKFQHLLYVKCEYFMNPKKRGSIMKYTTFCGQQKSGNCAACLKNEVSKRVD